MKNVAIVLTLLFIVTVTHANETSKEELLATGLPLVVIETINGEIPTCDFVTHPEGSMGEGITNKTKVGGQILILQGSDTLYNSGAYEKGESGMVVSLRGNTSAYVEKKPYKIKLQKKVDLLFRGEQYADKDWALIKDQLCFTNDNEMSLKPVIGFKVNELFGLQWTPQGMYVNVIFNDDYRGIYYLVETVKCNNRCRLDVNKDNGYVIEYDPYWWNEEIFFDTNKTSNQLSFKYTFKEPDEDEINDEQISYIKNYMNQVEASIASGSYADYIDVSSFINWILAWELLGTDDGGGANVYLTKKDNTTSSKVMMANLWDFDGIMIRDGQWSANHNILYYRELRNNESFNLACKERWERVSGKILPEINSFFDTYLLSLEAVSLDKARVYEQQRWGSEYHTVAENIDNARTWFTSRVEWINQKIGKTTGIYNNYNASGQNLSIYNLQGQHIEVPTKQIYIKNGRKYFSTGVR